MNPLHNSHSELPIIDWGIALKLSNNKREVAEELLGLLCKSLQNDIPLIQTAYHEKQWENLLKQLHKLRGAVSYCGTPRLKQAIILLENALKSEQSTELTSLFHYFEQEIALFISTCINLKLMG